MIIDEKGRFFGLVNLIDLIVVVALLIAIYVGVILIVVSRQPPLSIESIEPKVIENSLSQIVTVHLKNYQRLVSGTVTLLPHTGTSSSKVFSLEFNRFNREKATFNISNMDPGLYHLKFDIQTEDVLRRNHESSQIIESALTVEGWEGIPGLNEKNLQIEIQVLADKNNPLVADSTKPGDRLKIGGLNVDVSVLNISEAGSIEATKDAIVAGQESISKENKLLLSFSGRMSYINLSNLINYYLNTGEPLEILRRENSFKADVYLVRERTIRETTDRIQLDLPFVIMAVKPSQLEEIQNNKTIINPDGSIKAVVKTIDGYQFPDQDAGSGTDEKLIAAANKIVDIYLTVSVYCTLKDDGLYFDGKLLNENNLFSFKFGEDTVYGKLKNSGNTAQVMTTKIRTDNISNNLLDLVYDGLPLIGMESKQVVGKIKKVVRKYEATSKALDIGELRSLFKSAVFEVDLYYQVNSGNVELPDGQLLSFENDISLLLVSKPIRFKLQSQAQRTLIQTVWKEFEVEFIDLDKNLLKYLSENQRNIDQNEIQGIIIKELGNSYNSRREVELPDGTIKLSPRPELFNLIATVSMEVNKSGIVYYYNNNPIFIGQNINFGTDKINVQFKIRDFK